MYHYASLQPFGFISTKLNHQHNLKCVASSLHPFNNHQNLPFIINQRFLTFLRINEVPLVKSGHVPLQIKYPTWKEHWTQIREQAKGNGSPLDYNKEMKTYFSQLSLRNHYDNVIERASAL